MIDTHCHFDMMPNPHNYILDKESKGGIVIGMTNLPSHFSQGINHVKKYKRIRLALGFHPLLAEESQSELKLFNQFIDSTSYIGEIGLDFSKAGINSKEIQLSSLRKIFSWLRDRNKVISVHSRGAEEELLSLLKEYNIRNVIFHWYSGKVSLIQEIINYGYYFSINESMTATEKGRNIIATIPKERVLTETDAPYNKKDDIKNVELYLSKIYNCTTNEIKSQIKENFNRAIKPICFNHNNDSSTIFI
ncbi:TatD family deoxyribonuclease [Parabacteroides sp. 52]|uniref:TatD family hydrolase n=1 Tax=unclassified Parabacteroides TaxID=2649774 RepID=UPI0013D4534F|nr:MULTISPECIES: TatD family hydrolase [unclassified Parabacteroides]MDH6534810.1 TatD DNase family protein [Parabacteroides sp. PM5-20]NDV55814.1 TatD family deoxyribonuclease [Parabacteroides sp. 52]